MPSLRTGVALPDKDSRGLLRAMFTSSTPLAGDTRTPRSGVLVSATPTASCASLLGALWLDENRAGRVGARRGTT